MITLNVKVIKSSRKKVFPSKKDFSTDTVGIKKGLQIASTHSHIYLFFCFILFHSKSKLSSFLCVCAYGQAWWEDKELKTLQSKMYVLHTTVSSQQLKIQQTEPLIKALFPIDSKQLGPNLYQTCIIVLLHLLLHSGSEALQGQGSRSFIIKPNNQTCMSLERNRY